MSVQPTDRDVLEQTNSHRSRHSQQAVTLVNDAPRIVLNASYRVFGEVIAKVASLVLYVAIARQLGSADFGVYAFGLSFVTLVTVLADFGQDRVLTREVARRQQLVHRYFANTIVLKLILALPALTVALAVLTVTADRETRDVAALLGVAVVVEQLMATCFATYQAYERLVYVPIVLIIQRFLTTAVAIGAMLDGYGVIAVAGIYLGGACVGLVAAVWFLFVRVVRPRFAVRPRLWRSLMKAALPIGAAGVFAMALFRADMVMLAALSTAEDVGKYAAAYRLFETTLFLSWGVGAAVYPVYSRLSLESQASVRRVFERSLKLAGALVFPLAAGALVLAGPLVELLYGAKYEASADALRLLAPAIVLYPFGYLGSYLLVSQDRQRVLAPVYAVVTAENILLNFILIPAYSLYGAAIGSSLSTLLTSTTFMWFAARTLGGLGWVRMLAGPAIAATCAGVAAAVLHDHFAAAVGAMTVTYVVVLLLFERRAFPDDASVLRRTLSVRRNAAA